MRSSSDNYVLVGLLFLGCCHRPELLIRGHVVENVAQIVGGFENIPRSSRNQIAALTRSTGKLLGWDLFIFLIDLVTCNHAN